MLPHRSVRERRGTSSTARVSEVAHTMSCAGSITASDALNFALQDDNNEAECSTARTHDGQFAQFTMLNKAGAHLSFTIPFSELGALMGHFGT